MAAPPQKQWGTTPPISSALPTPAELAENDNLIAELKLQNNFEAPSETERRYVARPVPLLSSESLTRLSFRRKQTLQLIQRVTLEFVRTVGRKKGLSQAALDAAGGKIFTFGSYRLGVYGPGTVLSTRIKLLNALANSVNLGNFRI